MKICNTPTGYNVLEIKPLKSLLKFKLLIQQLKKLSPIKIKQKLIDGKSKKQNINIYRIVDLHL